MRVREEGKEDLRPHQKAGATAFRSPKTVPSAAEMRHKRGRNEAEMKGAEYGATNNATVIKITLVQKEVIKKSKIQNSPSSHI